MGPADYLRLSTEGTSLSTVAYGGFRRLLSCNEHSKAFIHRTCFPSLDRDSETESLAILSQSTGRTDMHGSHSLATRPKCTLYTRGMLARISLLSSAVLSILFYAPNGPSAPAFGFPPVYSFNVRAALFPLGWYWHKILEEPIAVVLSPIIIIITIHDMGCILEVYLDAQPSPPIEDL
jgi:hypothetical protein